MWRSPANRFLSAAVRCVYRRALSAFLSATQICPLGLFTRITRPWLSIRRRGFLVGISQALGGGNRLIPKLCLLLTHLRTSPNAPVPGVGSSYSRSAPMPSRQRVSSMYVLRGESKCFLPSCGQYKHHNTAALMTPRIVLEFYWKSHLECFDGLDCRPPALHPASSSSRRED
ncbi:uncharacterized protein LAESUDRAFT_45002 [Laetiporus sulphureus 93-53]|uniref:Uncharacterized protein n=1 Tax=Laetiporus sulphureus 93-53 TaxID=1314785 RepID=A0A165F8W6_9APHY|nr:uncharacterized protein LAESUDRAFT_45002 [Laetiporus sulphureus 93-53]KZT08610.1 hypothetical protein LAESUDRAFT_45002 [Laetiporus sulphureus 93-53]